MNTNRTAVWRLACRDLRHAAGETARCVLDAFVRAGERDFALALSGGRSASALFAELVRQAALRHSPLEVADYFWADERCVPPDHEDSNYRIARTEIFEKLSVAAPRIHRLAGELPPQRAVQLANQEWPRWIERRGSRGARLDCVLLGVGEDGHVASLFPQNLKADLTSTSPFEAVLGPKPPPQRLTMSYKLLWDARQVIVLASGPDKLSVIEGSMSGTLDTPLARVLDGRAALETVIVTVSGNAGS